MAGRSDDAAYASNWKTVLAVDAALGILGVAAGIGIAARGNSVAGSVLVGAGAAYLALTLRRFLRWRHLRASATPPLRPPQE